MPAITLIVAAVLALVIGQVSAHAAEELSVTRFRQVEKQSTPTSCGAASVATWLQRLGLRVREADILGSLQHLWSAKRHLSSTIRTAVRQGTPAKEIIISIRAKVDGLSSNDGPIDQAVGRLIELRYPSEQILAVAQSAAAGEYVPLGSNVGASRTDLEWAVNATGLRGTAVWRRLDVEKLMSLSQPVELSGVVLLPIADHFVALAGFASDLAGMQALIADPASATGGNLLVPVSRFVIDADPHGSGVVWILTLKRRDEKATSTLLIRGLAPLYLSLEEWHQRAQNSYVRLVTENDRQHLAFPVTDAVDALVRVDEGVLFGFQHKIQFASAAVVSSVGRFRESTGDGWAIEVGLRDVSGRNRAEFGWRSVFRGSSFAWRQEASVDLLPVSRESATSFTISGGAIKELRSLHLERLQTRFLNGAVTQDRLTARFGVIGGLGSWEIAATFGRWYSDHDRLGHSLGVAASRQW